MDTEYREREKMRRRDKESRHSFGYRKERKDRNAEAPVAANDTKSKQAEVKHKVTY